MCDDYIKGIIQIQNKRSFRYAICRYKKMLEMFGFFTIFKCVFSSFLAKILDGFGGNNYFSLKKVTDTLSIPFYEVENFNDIRFKKLMDSTVKDDFVLTQVSCKVPSEYTKKNNLINKHCALLPKYAGLFPVFWVMLNEEKHQGLTLHFMNDKIDGGNIITQLSIDNEGSFFEIYHKLYDIVFDAIKYVLERERDWRLVLNKQDLENYSYYSYASRENGRRFKDLGLKFGWPLRIRRK